MFPFLSVNIRKNQLRHCFNWSDIISLATVFAMPTAEMKKGILNTERNISEEMPLVLKAILRRSHVYSYYKESWGWQYQNIGWHHNQKQYQFSSFFSVPDINAVQAARLFHLYWSWKMLDYVLLVRSGVQEKVFSGQSWPAQEASQVPKQYLAVEIRISL